MEGSEKGTVGIIGTGGSISCVGSNRFDLVEYADFGRVLEIDELLQLIPEAAAVAEVTPIRFRAIRSTAVQPQDWLELARLISRVTSDAAYRGLVVTHGTATLEETAYFVSLTSPREIPIVFVAAQRPPSGLSSDGPLNLVNAIRVAASPAARGVGAVVALNDEIHAARDVTKTATHSLDTFRSQDTGCLGHVDPDGSVTFYRASTREASAAPPFDVAGIEALPRVDIAYAYSGADGAVIDAMVECGAAAIVSAGFAPGFVTPAQDEAFARAIECGVVVVQSTRGGRGRVLPRRRLRESGVVTADNLNPQKARVLAMLALTVTTEPAEVQRFFDTY